MTVLCQGVAVVVQLLFLGNDALRRETSVPANLLLRLKTPEKPTIIIPTLISFGAVVVLVAVVGQILAVAAKGRPIVNPISRMFDVFHHRF
jgi:hypothetical protein